LVLSIADNGAGFDKSIDSEGQGLTSMQRRAQRLKGIIEITSGRGFGTTVAVAVPM
jgi:signal transduction histidine kinase